MSVDSERETGSPRCDSLCESIRASMKVGVPRLLNMIWQETFSVGWEAQLSGSRPEAQMEWVAVASDGPYADLHLAPDR